MQHAWCVRLVRDHVLFGLVPLPLRLDVVDVMRVRERLREMGFTKKLSYKTDEGVLFASEPFGNEPGFEHGTKFKPAKFKTITFKTVKDRVSGLTTLSPEISDGASTISGKLTDLKYRIMPKKEGELYQMVRIQAAAHFDDQAIGNVAYETYLPILDGTIVSKRLNWGKGIWSGEERDFDVLAGKHQNAYNPTSDFREIQKWKHTGGGVAETLHFSVASKAVFHQAWQDHRLFDHQAMVNFRPKLTINGANAETKKAFIHGSR